MLRFPCKGRLAERPDFLMRIHDVLGPSHVKLPLEGRDRRGALEELVDLLAADGAIASRRDEVLAAIHAREGLMTCAIGRGVAIPHADLTTPVPMTVALGISPAGVDYGAPDGKPVHIVLLMIASRDQARERIEVLSAFSRMMRKESVRQDLVRARTADEALAILYREAESSEDAAGGAAPRPAA